MTVSSSSFIPTPLAQAVNQGEGHPSGVPLYVSQFEFEVFEHQGRASPYNLRPRNKVTNLDLQEEQCKPKRDQSGPEENHFGGQAFTTNVNTRNKVVNSRSKVKGTEDPVIIFLDKVDTPDIFYSQTYPHSEELGTVIEDDDDTNIDREKEFSLEQKLELVMTKKISTNQNSIQKPAISKAIRQEIDLFDEEEFRRKYLEKVCCALLTVPSTGVDAEKAFSTADNLVALHFKYDFWHMTATAGSDVVQSGRPIFDDFFQHLWPYIGKNTANVIFQMVKRLWLIRIDQ
ncbi:adhesion G protein-coupled receptor B2 [Trichonephila clavipes]|nr:adhesion G protein-coupled receptor B2 [Trichonephila clavipes]